MTEPSYSGSDRPYIGPSGRTRTEHVRVFRADKEPVETEVYRVVNVAEHPELRQPALSGTLHRLEDDEPVEVPFVFHDPWARQFALVVPEHARGRELSERASLLERLAQEDDAAVPPYVRHHDVLYGSAELARYVDEARRMEVDVHELEPVDGHEPAAGYYPALAGRLPNAGFWRRPHRDMAVLLADGALWAFVQLGADEPITFAESSSDLLLQLKIVDHVPVCILGLVDARSGAARRAFLSPAPSADRSILQFLRREFAVSVVVLDERRDVLRTFRLEAPRAPNARMILERTESAPLVSDESWRLAVDACRRSPPSLGHPEHPFVVQDDAPNAAVALQRLHALEVWAAPGRVDRALLIESVPRQVYEIARQQIVRDGARFGLAMSDALLAEAVRSGLAADAKSLVRALARRFSEMVAHASKQGLDEAEIDANRAALDRLCRLHGTSTEPSLSCTMEHSG